MYFNQYIIILYTKIHYNPLGPSVEYSLHLTKILILKKEGSIKKNPMSAASMSRQTLGAYFGLYLIYRSTETSTPGLKGIYVR